MRPKLWIDALVFSGGSQISLRQGEIVVIVGPNNSGKSATLRAVRQKLATPQFASPVLSQLKVGREGDPDDVLNWLGENTSATDEVPGNTGFRAFGAHVQATSVEHWWRAEGLHDLSRFFCHLLTGEERLSASNPPQSIAIGKDAPVHPIHYLHRDDTLEKSLSDQFRRAFGTDLIVHRSAGSQVPLLVGEKPVPGDGEDRISYSYIKRLNELSLLHEQGDGMRSFASILLYTTLGPESIVMVDEPEAFLHPPQARLIGRMLVKNKPASRQLLLATHSGDVLRGVLDAGDANIRVLRIRRTGTSNVVSELDGGKIAQLWADPLLRYSNILDGVFHEKVVVSESDGDSRFYAAIFDAVHDLKGSNTHRPDVMFTHCGGKARLALVVRSLRELDVPVACVADFDILREAQPLRDIVDAAGGDWSELEADWLTVKRAIDSKKAERSTDDIARDIRAALDQATGTSFPADTRAEIQKLLRTSSPWSLAKQGGKSFVPSGDPTKACDRLLSSLHRLDIHVVPVGELEGFVRSEGGHGPSWVNAVLQRDLQHDPELREAREFVEKLASV